MGEDHLITMKQLAAYLDVPLSTLQDWRLRGKGPRAIRVGRHLRFRQADVEDWLDRHADGPHAA